MTRFILAILCTLTLTAWFARADQDQKTAPPSACPVSGAVAAADQTAPPALPPGHPSVGGSGTAGNLPKGHPDISGMTKAPTTQPAATTARLIIREVQGTPNAPAAGGDAVSVDWHLPDQQMPKHVESKLDDRGMTIIENLPLATAAQPLVTVTHAGVVHEVIGEVMTPEHPDQIIDVKVYETTDQAPQWKVHMWHMMVDHTDAGLAVTEVLVIASPADRSWIGAADAAGKRTTFTLPLPAGAKDLQLVRGLRDSDVRIEGDRLVSSQALTPGINQYGIQFLLPIKDGQAKLDITAPAAVDNMIVMLPDDGTKLTATGMGDAAVMKGDQQQPSVRYYKAKTLRAGQKASLTVSGLKAASTAPTAPAGPGADAGASAAPVWSAPKTVASVGGGLLVTAGLAAVMFVKPAERKGKPKPINSGTGNES